MDLPRVLVHKAPGVESKIRMLRGSLGNSPQHALKQTLGEDSAPRERKQVKGHSPLGGQPERKQSENEAWEVGGNVSKGTIKHMREIPTSYETVPTRLEEQEREGG